MDMQRLALITLATVCLLAACWGLTRARRATFPEQASNKSSNSTAMLAALPSGNQAAAQPASASLLQGNTTGPASPGLVSSQFPPITQSNETPRKRTWDRHFLSTLSQTARGEGIRFELVDGLLARGHIDRLVQSDHDIDSISGTLTEPEPGRFFFCTREEWACTNLRGPSTSSRLPWS